MNWASQGAAYLQRVRQRAGGQFDAVLELFRGNPGVRRRWFDEGRSCIAELHRLSLEAFDDAFIPGRSFGSAEDFGRTLHDYESRLSGLRDRMTLALAPSVTSAGKPAPFEGQELLDLIDTQLAIVRYLRSIDPEFAVEKP